MIEIRAQYSMEFILIFAFSLAIILPFISFMHSEYSKSKEDLDESQAKQVLDQIIVASHNTFYSGYPSRITLDLYFPRGIISITNQTTINEAVTKSELVFNFQKGSNINPLIGVAPFRIHCSLNTADGRRKVLIKAEEDAIGTYINITNLK